MEQTTALFDEFKSGALGDGFGHADLAVGEIRMNRLLVQEMVWALLFLVIEPSILGDGPKDLDGDRILFLAVENVGEGNRFVGVFGDQSP